MVQSITRFINWLRVSDSYLTPVDVIGSADTTTAAGAARNATTNRTGLPLAESAPPVSDTKALTAAVVQRLLAEGRTPSTAADAARAFYTLNNRCATREEIHDIFITLDELGFIAD